MERGAGISEASLARSAPTDSIIRKLFALIARAHQMQGDFPAALKTCASRAFDSTRKMPSYGSARRSSTGTLGEPGEAEQCWRRILTLSRPQKFASVDQGIYGHLTRRNLAALAKERGDLAEAEIAMARGAGRMPR